MEKKLSDAQKINREIDKIMGEGFDNPLDRALIKDYYGREVTNTGKVRTYKEAVDYISKSKKYGSRVGEYTEDIYNQQIESLKQTAGKSVTYEGYKSEKRESYIKNLTYYIDEGYIDVSKFRIHQISTIELANTFKWAYAMAYNKITKKLDSEAFYTYIEERLENI